VYACPSHNTRLAQKCLYGIFGLRKTPFGLRPLRHFAPPHFACPAKPYGFAYSGRQNVANLKRYVPFVLKYSHNISNE